jgi:hypothetical protein
MYSELVEETYTHDPTQARIIDTSPTYSPPANFQITVYPLALEPGDRINIFGIFEAPSGTIIRPIETIEHSPEVFDTVHTFNVCANAIRVGTYSTDGTEISVLYTYSATYVPP